MMQWYYGIVVLVLSYCGVTALIWQFETVFSADSCLFGDCVLLEGNGLYES